MRIKDFIHNILNSVIAAAYAYRFENWIINFTHIYMLFKDFLNEILIL